MTSKICKTKHGILILIALTLFTIYNFCGRLISVLFPNAILPQSASDSPSTTPVNSFVLIRRPYSFDPECKNVTKRLCEPDTFNKTALVSYPGSGNTWLRHLIELSSGIYTGSVYFDLDLLSRGFLGEKEKWDSGSTVVQKVHFEKNKNFGFKRAILLIRDPYQSIVSFVQFLQSGHVGQGSSVVFRKREWPVFILGQTYKWISLAKSWLEERVSLLVVHYENVKRNTNFEMSRICQFLQIDCGYINTHCFQKYQEGHFHRKHKFRVNSTFPQFVLNRIDNGIDYLNNLLVEYGHPRLPLEYYPNYRKPSTEPTTMQTIQDEKQVVHVNSSLSPF